jgi:two-component SAPR family response regulator
MPGISGLELAENIKSINPRIQVILISGWALNLSESDLENRVDFVLNKPFSFEKITYTLSEAGKILAASNRKSSS